jgi:hypothetical protein
MIIEQVPGVWFDLATRRCTLFKVFHPSLFPTQQIGNFLVPGLLCHVGSREPGRVPDLDQGKPLAAKTGSGKAKDDAADLLEVPSFGRIKE